MTLLKDKNPLVHFDERADSWHQLYEKPQFIDRLALFVNGIRKSVTSDCKILDYGCGTGRIAIELAKLTYQVHGVDGSRGMIERARAEALKYNFPWLTYETIEPEIWYPRQQYDAIVCSSVLEYVPDDKQLLGNFAKGLVPGGILLISVPYKFSAVGIMGKVFHTCNRIISAPEHDVQFAHRRYSRTAFAKALLQVGLETINWTSFELPVLNQFGVRLSRVPIIGVMMLVTAKRIMNYN
jgi:2-polyprenyl-3-methyl-5-hydroxy-6-metoxy-1,4-benzoquinol methylase